MCGHTPSLQIIEEFFYELEINCGVHIYSIIGFN